MIELKAQIDALTVFQLMEISKHVASRMLSFGALAAPPDFVDFKIGEKIEFYSPKHHRKIQAIIEKINGKSLGCRQLETFAKWRVSPHLASRVSTVPEAKLGQFKTHHEPSTAPVNSHIPSVACGMW